ncbi:hypothetical protein [Diaphorobacter aerolatus]|uniref:Uncharacterized protein n=1 Tax=Diaphorobacter aerolatus TaxID=1288495 RepID=A0A7H0GJE6_9BURK|nr:hypothetical protein [Diaphorobacter aerolatus]QNP48412.1 hypothetical protein H9K75_21055 [Diaphorobacter aerolatus]
MASKQVTPATQANKQADLTETTTAPKEDKKPFNLKRYLELQDGVYLSDAEEAEYQKLRAEKRILEAKTRENIEKVVSLIVEHKLNLAELYEKATEVDSHLKIKPEDIFSETQIKNALERLSGTKPEGGTTVNAATTPKPAKEKGDALVIFSYKGDPKKRAAEFKKGMVKPTTVSQSVTKLGELPGDLRTNLLANKNTKAGEAEKVNEYLASEEGKKFVDTVVEYIKSKGAKWTKYAVEKTTTPDAETPTA